MRKAPKIMLITAAALIGTGTENTPSNHATLQEGGTRNA